MATPGSRAQRKFVIDALPERRFGWIAYAALLLRTCTCYAAGAVRRKWPSEAVELHRAPGFPTGACYHRGKEGKSTIMMCTLLLACLVVVAAATVEDVRPMKEKATAGEDFCRSVGSFCGSVKCSPRKDHGSFACDCGKLRYFNATAQRCFHVSSCPSQPCHQSECVDDDGNSAAECVCKEGPHITTGCQPKPEYKRNCGDLGGKLQLEETGNETVMPYCVCRPGTRLSNGTCRSIACLFPNFTCKDICSDMKLREDQSCCQGWNASSCNESDVREPNCEPGSIWNSAESRCENACHAGLSEPLCKHGCKSEARFGANYTCLCGDGEELNDDGVRCTVKATCSEREQEECAKRGRQCIVDAGKVLCRCQDDTIQLADSCSGTCTEEKKQECSTPLSWCAIKNYTEACICHPPLVWDYTSRYCVPGKERKYVVHFQEPHDQTGEDVLKRCSGASIESDVYNAMKTLYGNSLKSARVMKCGETVTAELTFSSEPPSPVLRMVRLCEVPLGPMKCLFPPSLDIAKGSVSDPVPVNLCMEYFKNIRNFSAGYYYCTSEEDGQCVLRCSNGNITGSIHEGFLEVQMCRDPHYTEEGTEKTWKLGTVVGTSLAAIFFLGFAVALYVLISRKRYCYYRLPPQDPNCGGVKFKARPPSQRHSSNGQEAAVNLVAHASNERTQQMQGAENEGAAERT